ncbi:MAG: hypothetical protein LBU23_08915, partial [Planctomycetota bacterium]|nr:hypothetical protein [Planctomycetota bacterium]
MSKAMLYQTSFNRGELDPALAGRADWEAYFAGAKTVRNLIVRPQGGVVKRGGSEFVALALEQEKPSLLVRFQFSAEQVYLLEFGDLRFRVFKDGGALLYPEGEELAGQEVVLPSPFPAADLAGLRHTQMEDVMVFTHPLHSPRRLIRHSHYDWRFSNLALSEDLPGPGGLYLTLTGGNQARYVVTAKIGDEETLPSAAAVAAPTGGKTAPDPAGSFSSQYDWLVANGGTPPGWLNFNAMTGDQMQAFCRSCGIQDVWLGTQVSGNNVTWHYVYPGETPPANWDYPHRTVTWQRYGPYT